MLRKKAQQEIVGFALIVVLVVVGLMLFLIYSFGSEKGLKEDDPYLGNLMSSIMHFTTTCSIDSSDQTILDLFTNCYNGEDCDNDVRPVCDVLMAELGLILNASFRTESLAEGMVVEFYVDDGVMVNPVHNFNKVTVGNCTGSYFKAFEQALLTVEDVYILPSSC